MGFSCSGLRLKRPSTVVLKGQLANVESEVEEQRMKRHHKLGDQRRSQGQRWPLRWIMSLLGATGALGIQAPLWAAEFPPCQSPNINEYLLLVISDSEAKRDQVQQLVPSGTTAGVCQYFEDVVVRVGGFQSLETANAWAQYLLTEVEAVQAFVARPPEPSPATVAASTSVYSPQPLEAGYAVLIDYANRPELALEVQQAIAREVGLAVYRQNPFLLALYTPDLEAASTVLRTLSDRDFAAMIVDSRQVMLLSPNVTTNLTRTGD